MSDLISRSELIKTYCEENCGERKCVDAMDRCIFISHVLNQPTVEAKPVEWIPCSERVPEDETLLYWTTHEDGSLVLHGYSKRNGFIHNWEVDDLEKRKRQGQVIAWTPVFEPQPYNADMRKKVE